MYKIRTLQLFQDGVRLAVGYEDGAIKVWDLKSAAVLQHVPAHTIRVTAIDTHPDNNLMASISTDGNNNNTALHMRLPFLSLSCPTCG